MAPVDLLQPQATHQLVQAKLNDLRSLMQTHQLDGYWIPSADEHLNEYLPEAKQRRTWISGFTGSAGDLLVGREQAWLFVDFRYYEQADLEVDSSLIQVSKLGLEGHKSALETLEALGQAASETQASFRLGFDPFTLAIEQFRAFETQLSNVGVELVPVMTNLVDWIRAQQPWVEAELLPSYADSPVFRLPEATTGETPVAKLGRVREALQKARVEILPLTKLDQIAWLFNLRGWDVPYNPVFIAYAIATPNQAFLFTNLSRMGVELQQSLAPEVALLPYEHYAETLKALVTESPAAKVLLDPKHTTLGTYQILTDAGAGERIVESTNPIEGMKARKNATEVAQMQASNLKASRAKTRALKWLAEQLASGQSLTEVDVATTLETFYSQEADFQGLSFNTIAAVGPNSSIVHYGTPSAQAGLASGSFLLIDSGAQYLSGTTDDTRTVIVGEPTPEQIERYTAVLKAHINCAMQRFPKGTTGVQLDGIARSALWHLQLDYGHGTGHGVGAFLNVHEGPNGISKRAQEPLEPGMVTSIEPGYYEPGWGGIRIENLYVVVDRSPEQNGQSGATPWYGFESLTYIPFDKRLINLDRLDYQQRDWLERYHATVVEKLAPTLSPDEAAWLQEACRL